MSDAIKKELGTIALQAVDPFEMQRGEAGSRMLTHLVHLSVLLGQQDRANFYKRVAQKQSAINTLARQHNKAKLS